LARALDSADVVTKTAPSSTPRHTERQPGERAPAPGDLGLVQAFVNTRWDLDNELEEQLRSPSEIASVARRTPAARTLARSSHRVI
jgi:hypothetical protein